MRLWSFHSKYPDGKRLMALWREGQLAKRVIRGIMEQMLPSIKVSDHGKPKKITKTVLSFIRFYDERQI